MALVRNGAGGDQRGDGPDPAAPPSPKRLRAAERDGRGAGPRSLGNRVTVVLGAQWGDEGKGKVVDLLAQDADLVCRCQGGNNAGHTVVAEKNLHRGKGLEGWESRTVISDRAHI
ncbi:hypothetical protein scyTo_0022883, partial [Scyliorhinus torazame]|nr:hypothetical protein [Scyliorhinus torazame]